MTKNEFLSYLLLYAAGIDTVVSPKELAFIRTKVGPATFEKTQAAFEAADELEKVETILTNARRLGIDKTTLQTELRALGLADAALSVNENYLIHLLGRLLG